MSEIYCLMSFQLIWQVSEIGIDVLRSCIPDKVTVFGLNLQCISTISTKYVKESGAADATMKLSSHLMSSSNLSSGLTTINPRIEHSANISGNQAQNVSGVDLLIVVTSSPENMERRNIIRKSWASSPLVFSGQVKVVFMLGQKVNMSESEREAIQES